MADTRFRIIRRDNWHEYAGRDRHGNPLFVEESIPHKGKRYKNFSNAVGIALEVTASLNLYGGVILVQETYL